jgi:anti-sigma regulatory factor (Ser/Thr protein kinase)
MALAGTARRLPLDDENLEDLKLVLSEVCAHAIERAQAAGGAPIELDLRAEQHVIEVSVTDHGDPLPGSPGLGLALLRRLCTTLETGPAVGDVGLTVTFSLEFG